MNLNHMNLCASNVVALSDVFVRCFGFDVQQVGKAPKTGDDFAMLRGSDGFSLVITTIDDKSPQAYPTGFHVGFMVDTPDMVHFKHQELSQGGCHPGQIKIFEAIGSVWTAFYCPVGDGIEIEVNARQLNDP